MDHSPVISPSLRPKVEVKDIAPLKLLFPTALEEVIAGKKITRLEWNNTDTQIFLNAGFLMIRMDNKLHQLILSEADLVAEDWVVVG